MPLPERYAQEVPDVMEIWEGEGRFRTQASVWQAESIARHELYGAPSIDQLAEIETALILTPEDIEELDKPEGHETNKLLRRVQSRTSPEAGNFIHLGNTSSDILDTALALQMRESLGIVKHDFEALSDSLKNLALEHQDTLQVGRTHGQWAVPQTFGRQVLGWYAEVKRGVKRIEHATEEISVGKCSGEIGTHVFIEPELEELTLSKLGLRPDEASTQIISRDRHSDAALLMGTNGETLTRIATNIRLLAQADVGEVREPFDAENQQGSSSMPHKRNPELSERIEGLNRVLHGSVMAQLEAQHAWLERDISHSSTERFTMPVIFGVLAYQARLMKKIIDGLVVNKDRMLENLNRTYGVVYSSRLLNSLIDMGISRTEAYETVKRLAQTAMDTRQQLHDLAAAEPLITDHIPQDTLDGLFDPNFYLQNINTASRRLHLE